MIVHYKATLK